MLLQSTTDESKTRSSLHQTEARVSNKLSIQWQLISYAGVQVWSDHAASLDRTLIMSSATIQSTDPNRGWDGSDGPFQIPATASWLHCSDAATQRRSLVFVPMVDHGDGTSSSSRENSVATTASQGHGVPPVLGARDLAQQQRGLMALKSLRRSVNITAAVSAILLNILVWIIFFSKINSSGNLFEFVTTKWLLR